MTDKTPSPTIDKQAARQSFNQAAGTYDSVAVLQREVGQRMLERLDIVRLEPNVIVDIGCGTGDMTQALAKRYKQARIVALDFAEHMLTQARGKQGFTRRWLGKPFHYVCGDAERLPLADDSADFIFSNLTLQWCNDLDTTFTEFNRILRPGGLLMFSTLGPDTLKELRESWLAIDNQPHVHPFIDMHHVGDALLRARLADPVMDVEHFTLTFNDGYQLMRELKQLGAHNAAPRRSQGLTGKSQLQKMLRAYEHFRNPADNKLPATYEVVYGHAWAPMAQKPSATTVNVDFQPAPHR
ncbi:MAG: malonyl-ACP O-methyltransferase BioC [Gammaproteobacteria bacterium]|jgi:malonyl-CoA O-methyltransferase